MQEGRVFLEITSWLKLLGQKRVEKNNRHSLTIRIQARDGTPLSKLIERLEFNAQKGKARRNN